ncbi:hypothetical protein Tco_1528342 [Tanacetum coccineum]
MSYYSESKTDLAMIGAEGFAILDNKFSCGRNSKPPSLPTTAPSPRTPQQTMFPYQYKSQQSYFVQQVPAKRTEIVIDCYEAVKVYGGTLIVDKTKRKPARRGIFY